MMFMIAMILSPCLMMAVQVDMFSQHHLQQEIVNVHNDYRTNRLTWPAANMNKLSWSDRLAGEAARVAAKCDFKHDVRGYGQNIYRDTGRYADHGLVHNFMHKFGEEEQVEMIKQTQGYWWKPVGEDVYDHYSQVVWSETERVGCAYAFDCPESKRVVVCNYYPSVGSP